MAAERDAVQNQERLAQIDAQKRDQQREIEQLNAQKLDQEREIAQQRANLEQARQQINQELEQNNNINAELRERLQNAQAEIADRQERLLAAQLNEIEISNNIARNMDEVIGNMAFRQEERQIEQSKATIAQLEAQHKFDSEKLLDKQISFQKTKETINEMNQLNSMDQETFEKEQLSLKTLIDLQSIEERNIEQKITQAKAELDLEYQEIENKLLIERDEETNRLQSKVIESEFEMEQLKQENNQLDEEHNQLNIKFQDLTKEKDYLLQQMEARTQDLLVLEKQQSPDKTEGKSGNKPKVEKSKTEKGKDYNNKLKLQQDKDKIAKLLKKNQDEYRKLQSEQSNLKLKTNRLAQQKNILTQDHKKLNADILKTAKKYQDALIDQKETNRKLKTKQENLKANKLELDKVRKQAASFERKKHEDMLENKRKQENFKRELMKLQRAEDQQKRDIEDKKKAISRNATKQEQEMRQMEAKAASFADRKKKQENNLKNEMEASQRKVDELGKKLRNYDNSVKELNGQISGNQVALRKAEKKKQELATQLEGVNKKIKSADANLETHTSQLKDKEQQIKALKEKSAAILKDQESINQNIKLKEKERDTLKKAFLETQEGMVSHVVKLDRIKKEEERLKIEMKERQQNLDSQRLDKERTQTLLNSLTKENAHLKSQAGVLKEHNAAMSSAMKEINSKNTPNSGKSSIRRSHIGLQKSSTPKNGGASFLFRPLDTESVNTDSIIGDRDSVYEDKSRGNPFSERSSVKSSSGRILNDRGQLMLQRLKEDNRMGEIEEQNSMLETSVLSPTKTNIKSSESPLKISITDKISGEVDGHDFLLRKVENDNYSPVSRRESDYDIDTEDQKQADLLREWGKQQENYQYNTPTKSRIEAWKSHNKPSVQSASRGNFSGSKIVK